MLVPETKTKIRTRIKMIQIDKNWSIEDMCAITGDKPGTMLNKLRGAQPFNLDDVINFVEASGVSYDYICGR